MVVVGIEVAAAAAAAAARKEGCRVGLVVVTMARDACADAAVSPLLNIFVCGVFFVWVVFGV